MATLSRDEYKRREENQQQQTADRHCIVLVKAERESGSPEELALEYGGTHE